MKFLQLAVVATALSAAPLHAAPVALVNAGFEDGLNGWTTVGGVATASTTITTFDGTEWDIFAAGTGMAQLQPGASWTDVAAALGVAPGVLSDPTGDITNASAIYQSFSGAAGDTVSMYWDYVATDYIPYDDPAFALVIGPSGTIVQTLASIYGNGIAVGTSGHSGWQQFSYTLGAAGDYTLAFVTTNTRDSVLNSFLFLDGTPGSCEPQCPPPVDPSVPEPTSIALLALGGAFAIGRRLRR